MSDQRWAVCIYLMERYFGGPEEGGWYYSMGELRRVVRIFPAAYAAALFANRFNDLLDRLTNATFDALGSEAYYWAEVQPVIGGAVPPTWPAQRPHYE